MDTLDQTPQQNREDRHCVVCAKPIHAGEETLDIQHGDDFYTVCCPVCGKAFLESPQKYIAMLPKKNRPS